MKIWTIARFTWREGIRKKTLIGFLFLSILVIFGASFMTAFLEETTVGAVETDVNLKLLKDICVTTISIFGALIAIFMAAAAVPGEVENRVIYTVLSKPMRRFEYLIGKFLGVQLIILANLALMGGLFFAALLAKEQVIPWLLLVSLLLSFFEFFIVSAFTFAVASRASSAVLPTIAGLFIYITGNLTQYLDDVRFRTGQTDLWFEAFIGQTAQWLYQILPNLQQFSIKHVILNTDINFISPSVYAIVPNAVLYGVVYGVAGWILSAILFRKREF